MPVGFVAKLTSELRPPRITYSAGERVVGHHADHIEVFKDHQIVGLD
jgi:hypothetical protein